ncbi:hypothetical protein [Aestuariibacter salexigens]|uniref:hypothetical protein n=1 Tax=Aestuariibacter salexigens TaxID=226010 RepID=UPI000420175E|nr:hypothetical protein [Aestuariibacter salexigens]
MRFQPCVNYVVAAYLAIAPLQSFADVKDLQAASQALCDKLRECTLQNMQQAENITPEIRQMAEAMVSGMCAQFVTAEQIKPYPDLVEPATACLQSAAALSCSDFEQNPQTPACQAFEQKAAKYGVVN